MSKERNNSRLDKSSYDTKYPYNQCMITECGHEVHFDNTPGKERIRIVHKDGWVQEIHPGGHETKIVSGHSESAVKGGQTVTINENNDVKVEGHARILVGAGSHSETTGDSSQVMGGHVTIVVGGDAKIAAAGNVYVGAKGDGNFNIAGNMDMKVGGTASIESGGNMSLKAPEIHLNG